MLHNKVQLYTLLAKVCLLISIVIAHDPVSPGLKCYWQKGFSLTNSSGKSVHCYSTCVHIFSVHKTPAILA